TLLIRSHHTGSHGSQWRGVHRRTHRDGARSHSHGCLCHRLRVHESCPWHCSDSTGHILIHIGRCLNVVVHHVGDGGLLHHGVCDVHVGDVRRAGLARGHVHFAG